ncbi:MAG: hypothetical protein IKZ41_06080 [Clostridia bacterium]|nr:hypothetical protein [Clostridia bacterium]MBR5365905.1 hypothetical protein [Clostridia bacterium]
MPRQDEKLAVAGKIEPEFNRHYAKVAKRYAAAGILCMILFVAYLLGLIVFGSEYITYDNMRYLIRDFGTAAGESAREFGKIVYNGSSDTVFAYFRGGAAVCSPDTYRYFDKNGTQIIADPLNYADPVLAPSEKYMLVYDMGGTGYAVYNQLTGIVSKETEGKIIAADIADDGSLALVTRSKDTKFVVELYNAAFNKTMEVYKDGYVLGVAMAPDGKQFLVASAVQASTDFNCEIQVCERGSDEPVSKETIAHAMPLAVRATDDGYLVLCDTAVYYYSRYGTVTKTVSLAGMTLKYADECGGRIALVGQVNALGSEHRVLVLAKNGEPLYDDTMRLRVSGIRMARGDDALCYLVISDGVIRVAPDSSLAQESPESGDILDVIPLGAGALLCQKNAAYQVFIGKK